MSEIAIPARPTTRTLAPRFGLYPERNVQRPGAIEAAIVAIKLRGARPRKEDRRTIEAIIWRLNNGAKWRSIPAELGNWHHAYLRFRRWAISGVWDKIMAHVVAEGEPKLAFACIDGTVARAHQKAAGARPSKPIR